jgi:glycosyltransferase involved in cell wall biosynthesis
MSRRVLFFCDTTAPGGVDVCVRDLALAALEAGWEVMTAIDRDPGADRLAAELAANDIHSARITLHKQWDENERQSAVDRALTEFAPDVVHVHLPAPWAGVAPRERALERGIRLVATEHNVSASFTLAPELRARLQRVYRAARAHIAVSHETKRLLVEQFEMPADKIVVIPNAVDLAYWRPATVVERAKARRQFGVQDESMLACVARLTQQKGVDVLLRACALEPLRSRHWRLFLAGDGPDEKALRELARDLEVDERVRWLGWQSDVRALLAAADVFVLPSRWEGQPLTVLEAMAAGAPVVATAVSGTPEALDHGRLGALVPPDDPTSLSAALARAIDEGKDEARLRHAREYVAEHHDRAKNLQRTMALWTS